ncbi:cAMP-binding domain of CRP or a regulatory subunit of cAMP-dependent protein kinases [Chitinophaga sp. CF118]|uniref:Crp/Fnr family transcriptional regulator n=1 Tax=Chitinophaga sp. CF118 TaxID=1884367 RepID=UPI0008E2C815|nr:Crp/Fnr family transcriptional regulator [Chitinophaga sp. CF118]SFE97738.1 cAMP-binding domain of CRP or a regulatory subunit of cAMP-dependent protein kinases [Chitinophaga sp. CF118]
MEKLIAYIHSLMNFSEESWEILSPALITMEFEKDQYLLQAGKVCNSLFYISKGYCRAFYDKDGQEINTSFFFENSIATNINSFAKEEKSEFSIQACENLTVVQFDKKKLREASQLDPAIEMLGRNCLQRIAAKQENDTAIYKLMTAKERYEYLEKYSPDILQRVSLTQLSSYLGVARETLSRIRSRRVL